jgi:Transglycosylase SLT domain
LNAQITNIIANAAATNGVPAPLALAQAQQESSGNPAAYNPSSGATGLFQLEPATAAQYGVTNPLDPTQSAAAGTSYLADLYAEFGDWASALAAYDWGPTNVKNAQAKYGSNWLDYAPTETQNYVSNILGNAGMDTTATVTPASVATGIATYMFAPSPTDEADETDDETSVFAAPVSASPNWLLIGGLALAALLVFDFIRNG